MNEPTWRVHICHGPNCTPRGGAKALIEALEIEVNRLGISDQVEIIEDEQEAIVSGLSRARPGDLVFTNTWRGPNRVGHVMVVYDPASHRSIEARGRGVGIYHYTDFANHNIYEVWRVGNLTD